MKHFTNTLVLLTLVSCGAKKTTKNVLIENPFDNTKNDERLLDLENKVATLEMNIQAGVTTMNNLTNSIELLDSTLNDLNDQMEHSDSEKTLEMQQLIDTNSAEHNNLIALIAALQGQVNNNVSQLATLQAQNNVIGYLDPCGDKVNSYDEIILKTTQGEFIAYFEQNGTRFLTKLEKNVLYQTTDSQACVFKINNEGNLV